MEMVQSSAKALIACHSSLDVLLCLRLSKGILKMSFSNWLKNTCRLGWPFGGFQEDLEKKQELD